VLVEKCGKAVDVTVARVVNQLAFHADGIDMRLERTPAGEAVLLGQLELRVGQLGGRVRSTQLVESALGLLAEPVQVGSLGEGPWRG
jgi:hypothetical protein